MDNEIDLNWNDICNLRVIKNLLGGLKNLGVPSINLIRKEPRKSEEEKVFSLSLYSSLEFNPCNRFQELSNGCTKFRNDNARKRCITAKCPYNFNEIITPITIEDKVIGWFQATGIISMEDEINKIKDSWPADLNNDKELDKILNKLECFSSEKLEIISSLMNMMADEIGIYHLELKNYEETKRNIDSHKYHGIIFSNQKVKDIISRIDKIAKSDSPVMIYGESGVGKELYAKLLHNNSSRKGNNFLILNCAALTETLLEAELFGFEKGSFTGSIRDKAGLFEIADKGTVLLDEIGDMSTTLQVKILRLIQEGTFIRVGGTKTLKVDVRIIGATNKNIEELIQAKIFREDLYFRLAVFEINIPPLRERRDEVPILCNYFIDKYQEKMKKKGVTIENTAIETLCNHDWPGNIRELENEIERAVALCEDYGRITQQNLSNRILSKSDKIYVRDSLKSTLNEYEAKIIQQTLNENRWNKKRVSKLLGITQQWLNKRIHTLEIDRRKKII